MSDTITLAFYSGLSADELEMLKSVCDYTFSAWSVNKKTETGEVSQNHLHLSSIDRRGESYVATLRVNLGGLLGGGLQRVNERGIVENRWAYASLSANSDDELFESFETFYNAALEFPRNENGSIYLEKGNGATLAGLTIPTRGTFLVTIQKEMLKSGADVVDSGYFRVESYDVFGDVQFSFATNTRRDRKKLGMVFAPSSQSIAPATKALSPGFNKDKVGGGFPA
jgi:hypothetical protein